MPSTLHENQIKICGQNKFLTVLFSGCLWEEMSSHILQLSKQTNKDYTLEPESSIVHAGAHLCSGALALGPEKQLLAIYYLLFESSRNFILIQPAVSLWLHVGNMNDLQNSHLSSAELSDQP